MIKLVVVDEHPVIIKGLEAFFKNSRNTKFVGHLKQSKAVLEYIKTHQVDILLTEINLENINGITLIKRIKRHYPEVKIIVFTSEAETIYGANVIKSGASGFVSKTEDLRVLDKAILKVYNNAIYISENIAKQLTNSTKKTSVSNDFKTLSTRELEVLTLISEGKRNKEIALQLAINEKTVSTYKTRLMKKLHVNNLVELIHKAKQTI
jgi:DNA-binding NarL/FixJ family response regulator